MALLDDKRAATSPIARLERHDGFVAGSVAGTPRQLGEQHGEMLRAEIRAMLAALNHHVIYGQPGVYGKGLRAGAFGAARLMERRIAPHYKEEMRALARAADVPYREILLLNCVDDVLANLAQLGELYGRLACSAFAATGEQTADGQLLAGRNLDYFVPSAAGEDVWAATNYMKEHVVAVHYTPAGGHSFLSVGWPGFIGVATGMSEPGLCIGSLTVATRRNWPFARPATFIYRDILQDTTNLADAVDLLRRSPRAQGNNVLIGSGPEADARVVEFTPWRLSIREPVAGWIATTNHYVAPEMVRFHSQGVVFSSGERIGRLDDMRAAAPLSGVTQAGEMLTDQGLRVPEANEYCGVFNPCTIYSVVFAPGKKELWVRVADRPDRTFERLGFGAPREA
jgi:hypothetical protein